MMALSLWSPWAQLIRIRAKRTETRSWGTDYRGPLAIHCAKKIVPDFGQICHSEYFREALTAAGYDEMECFDYDLGKIICVADLVAVKEVVLGIPQYPKRQMIAPPDPEYSFGNFEAGRFGWHLENVRVLKEPVPFRGRQRLFEVPDGLLV